MIARLLISSSVDIRLKEIENILSKAGFKNPHPDLLYFDSDSKLGISEARKIKEYFSFKPYQAKGRAVVLEDASSLTVDAQNALLKTLEEPPGEAILLLGASSDVNFLPTILSRCQIIYLQNPTSHPTPTSEVGYEDIKKLLDASIEQRFEYVEKLKDREELLHEMVKFFREELHKQRTQHDAIVQVYVTNKQIHTFLQDLLQAEEWAKANVNIRAILEYLMLKMPMI